MKRILVLFFCILLMFSFTLTGCQKPEEKKPPAAPAPEKAAPAPEKAPAAPDKPGAPGGGPPPAPPTK
ncbi:MAG: hypothetical protein PHG91_06195 [Syntrophales bacterium]|nr:hypothetical protein [Syntrophales bacterium]MDD5232966.1 hypothetical protein [Syntrophales bacterium]MDD5532415.1 hypothetical protein [Syntrophales bacterium]